MGRKSSARTRAGAEDGSEPAPADATGQRNIFRAARQFQLVAVTPSSSRRGGVWSLSSDGERRAVIAGLVPARAARAAVLHRRPPRSLSRRAPRVGLVYGGGGASCSWAAASKLHADRVAGRRRVPSVQNSAAQPAAAGGRGGRRRSCWRGRWQGYRRSARRARTRGRAPSSRRSRRSRASCSPQAGGGGGGGGEAVAATTASRNSCQALRLRGRRSSAGRS